MAKLDEFTPLFHRIYSVYFRTVRRILKTIHANKNKSNYAVDLSFISEADLKQIIQSNAFPDDAKETTSNNNALIDKLQEWLIISPAEEIDNAYTSSLYPFTRPQTTLEKHWLGTIARNPHFDLFVASDEDKQLQKQMLQQPSLYNPEMWVMYDQFTDGDNFSEPLYKENFQIVLKAVQEQKYLNFEYFSNNYKEKYDMKNVIPLKLEYSPKNDKFRLLAITNGQYGIYNISNIKGDCKLGETIAPEILKKSEKIKPSHLTATIEVTNSRNALQRTLLALSDYKKEVQYLRKDKSSPVYHREMSQTNLSIEDTSKHPGLDVYQITIYYLESDIKELAIRILSMGHLLKVVASDSPRNEGLYKNAISLSDEITSRIKKQLKMRATNQAIKAKTTKQQVQATEKA